MPCIVKRCVVKNRAAKQTEEEEEKEGDVYRFRREGQNECRAGVKKSSTAIPSERDEVD